MKSSLSAGMILCLAFATTALADSMDDFPATKGQNRPKSGEVVAFEVATLPDSRGSLTLHQGSLLMLTSDALYRTADQGQTWQAINVRPQRVVNAGANGLIAIGRRQLFVSRDEGAWWNLIRLPGVLADDENFGMAGDLLYVITTDSVYVTRTLTEAWRRLSLPTEACTPSSVAAEGDQMSLVCQEGDDDDALSDIYVSGDRAVKWTKIGQQLKGPATVMMIARAGLVLQKVGEDRMTLLALQNGKWTPMPLPEDQTRGWVKSVTGTGRRLFASNREGLYKSADGGRSWERVRTPPGTIVKFEVGTDSVVAAIDTGGRSQVFFSRTGGVDWETLPDLPNAGATVTGLTILGDAVCVRVGRDWFRLVNRTPQGWVKLQHILPNYSYRSRTGLALASGSKELFLADNTGEVYRSVDRGDSWPQMPRNGRRKHGRSYVETSNSSLIVWDVGVADISVDGGQTWKALEIPSVELNWKSIKRVNGVLHGVLGRNAAESQGDLVFASQDDGRSWSKLSALPGLANSTYSGTVPGPLAVFSRRVVMATDSSGVWKNVTNGPLLRPDLFLKDVYVDSKGTIFLAAQNAVIWSRDRGTTWNSVLGRTPMTRDDVQIVPYKNGDLLVGMGRKLFLIVGGRSN